MFAVTGFSVKFDKILLQFIKQKRKLNYWKIELKSRAAGKEILSYNVILRRIYDICIVFPLALKKCKRERMKIKSSCRRNTFF